MTDGTLSPVFNIRGKYFQENSEENIYSTFNIYDENHNRLKITFNEETGIIYKEGDTSEEVKEWVENAFGTIRIHTSNSEFHRILGIKIYIDDK